MTTTSLARTAIFVGLVASTCGCAEPADPLGGDLEAELAAGQRDGDEVVDHSELDRLLEAFVDEAGLVDYDGLRGQRPELDHYLERLATVDLTTLPADEQLALFIDAYNAHTLATVLDGPCDLASIKDLEDPWDEPRCRVGGHRLSLNDIEHRVVRPYFDDPRVHFALNCASIGCPPLRREAYRGPSLDAQLDAATRETLSDPRYLRVDGESIVLTRILSWYRDDFERDGRTLVMFVREYGPTSARESIDRATGEPPLRFATYDWSLNREQP